MRALTVATPVLLMIAPLGASAISSGQQCRTGLRVWHSASDAPRAAVLAALGGQVRVAMSVGAVDCASSEPYFHVAPTGAQGLQHDLP